MKLIGIVLIVIGIVMIVTNGFNFQTKEKVADIGPVELNKTENHRVTWPWFAGGAVIIGGIAVLAVSRNRNQ